MDYINFNIIVYQCYDWVLLCSELLQESESTGRQQEQRQSPEETGMCVCGGGDEVWVDVHPCVCVWGYVQSPEATGVCGGVGGGGVECACIWVCVSR